MVESFLPDYLVLSNLNLKSQTLSFMFIRLSSTLFLIIIAEKLCIILKFIGSQEGIISLCYAHFYGDLHRNKSFLTIYASPSVSLLFSTLVLALLTFPVDIVIYLKGLPGIFCT